MVERLGDAIGVKRERVTGKELALANRAVPVFEKSHDGAIGIEAFESAVTAQEQGRQMATIRVAEAARGVVVFGEEESGVSAVRRVFAKKLVHGAQQAFRLVQSDRALAAEVGLQICHQESGCDSLARNVAD